MPREPRCWWCDGAAELLCDAILGFPGDHSHRALSRPWTCDAEMCAACAKRMGCILALEDTLDLCPEHSAGRMIIPLDKQVGSPSEAAEYRKRVMARAGVLARRAAMHIVPPGGDDAE